MACGAPEAVAGGLMSHDGTSQCYFVRQPESVREVDAAIRATWSSCCGAVRYGGEDQDILTRFAELDCRESCDFRPPRDIPVVRRDRARFRYPDNPVPFDKGASPRTLLDSLAASVHPSKYNDCRDFKYTSTSAAFTYVWSILDSIGDKGHSIRIEIQKDGCDSWLLKLSDNQVAVNGTAAWLDEVLQKNPLVQDLRWFSSEFGGSEHLRPHPY